MDDRRALIEALRAADRSLGDTRMPPGAAKRVGIRLRDRLRRRRSSSAIAWVPMATFIAGAALVLLVVASSRRDPPRADSGSPLARVAVQGADCERVDEDPDHVQLTGACTVQSSAPSMRVVTEPTTEVVLAGRRVELRHGRATFEVDPVHGDPLRVVVPGGEIVVVGTRFEVDVDATTGRGEIELFEGALRFEHGDGRVSPIAAGEVFAFSRAALPPRPSPAPARPPASAAAGSEGQPAPPPVREASPRPGPRGSASAAGRAVPEPAAASPGVDEIIEEVAVLRRAGRYADAAARLRRALQQRWDTRTAEVLSYELGTILGRHLDDDAAACAHWRAHATRFGTGRYAKQVARARETLGCDAAGDERGN